MLVLVGVGVPALLGVASGAIGVPHNDDFNYRRVALGLYEDGQVQLTRWTVMSLIGQLALVQPFLWLSGGAPSAFATMTAILALIGIVASYLLARRLLLTFRSFIAVLIVLLFPGFLLNTTSFMTDVPAYAGEMLCLALGAAALQPERTQRWRWLVASFAVGLFAYSIREFALAAPAAVLVSATMSATDRRIRYLAVGVVLLVACVAVSYITSHLAGQGTAVLAPLSESNVERTRLAVTTLAFGLSPVLIIAAAWWLPRVHVPETVVGAVAGLILFGGSVLDIVTGSGIPTQLVGNLLVREGAPGDGALAGARPFLFGSPWWEAMNLLALVAAVLGLALLGGVIGLVIRRRRAADRRTLTAAFGSVTGLLFVFVLIVGSGLVVFGLVASMFDRYLWPLTLPLATLLLLQPPWAGETPARRWRVPALVPRAAAGIATFTLATSSLVLLLNSDAFDAARWRIGEQAVSAGFAPQTIDAGMEWVGYHASGTANVEAIGPSDQMWYTTWWPSFHQCAIVSSSLLDIPGFHMESANLDAYRLLLVAGPESPLYLYRTSNPGCP
jgi:4-amino-4-deoxy-L-arabinose transferase-like glycosyltransferase